MPDTERGATELVAPCRPGAGFVYDVGEVFMFFGGNWQNMFASKKPVTPSPVTPEIQLTCPNCQSVFLGPFCAQCGQPRDIHRRRIGKLVHDVLKDIISFDSRILRTIWTLLFKPGELTAAYREGRTQRYVPAVRLYLFASLFFFVALATAHIAILQLQVTLTPFTMETDSAGHSYIHTGNHKETIDAEEKAEILKRQGVKPVYYSSDSHSLIFSPILPEVKELSPTLKQMLSEKDEETDAVRIGETKINITEKVNELQNTVAHNPAALNKPLSEWIARVLFLLLPVFAFLLALFYVRQRKDFYFVDHMVFSLNYHSFGFALLLITAALKQTAVGISALYFIPVGLWVYLLLSLRRVYRQSWFWSVVKTCMLSGFYFIFQTLALLIIIFGVLGIIPENIVPAGAG